MLAFFYGLEKLLGFARAVLIARQFGLSAELDAFNTANNLPDLLFALIAGGALGMALIPILTETLQKQDRQAAWALFSKVANLMFLSTALLSLLVAIFAEPLVRWRLGIAPGFSSPQQELVADLMRLNLIGTLLLSLAGLIIAGLQANQHFLLPAIAPAMYDLGTLFGVLILSPTTGYSIGPVQLPAFGLGVHGLVYGTILGNALFLGVQIPGLVRYGFRWTPALDIFSPIVRRTIGLLLPRIGTVLCIQLVFLATDNIASRLPEGGPSALVYGWLILQMPETLIGTAIGTALLPTLSEQITRGESGAFTGAVRRAVQVIVAITLPTAVLIGLALPPLVGLLFDDPAEVERVVWTARAFLIGLTGHTLLEVAVRAFYARQKPLVPLWAAAGMFVVFLSGALILAPLLDTAGIALANSIAFTLEAAVLLWLLDRSYPGLLRVGGAPARAAVGMVVGGVAAFLVGGLLPEPGLLQGLLLAAAAVAAGALAALPFIWPEMKLLLKL
jgi:putative peptidoglycan lipid II flippase